MALQGNLEDFSLAEILQLIALQRKSGVLRLTSETSNAVLFFEKGNIVSVTDRRETRSDALLKFLVATERLSVEQVDQICAIRSQNKKDPLEIIIAGGYLSNKQLSESVEAHARELLPELLSWKKGDYFFSGDEKTVGRLFFKVPMRTEALLIESMRRLDESARIKQMYSPALILCPKESAQKDELADEEKWILGLMDGRRSIREILGRSRMGEFDTYQIISDLIAAGFAEVAEWPAEPVEEPVEERRPRGKQLVQGFGIAFVVILITLASLGLRWTVTKLESTSPALSQERQPLSDGEEKVRFALEVYKATYSAYPHALNLLAEENFVDSKSLKAFRYVKTSEGYSLEKKP